MANNKKILFFDYWPEANYLHACGAGLGSSLFKLAALAEASIRGFEVHLLTSPLKQELLEDAYGIDFIYSKPLMKSYESFHKVINLGLENSQLPEDIKNLKNYHPFETTDRSKYKSSAHLSFWKKFVANSLNFELSQNSSKIDLCLESEEVLKAVKLMPSGYTWIAIPFQSISILKNYTGWDEVIDLLLKADDKIKILLLGDKAQELPDKSRVVNMMGKSNIQFLKAIISQVSLLIGVDGLATNIAMVQGKPTLALFTMISPENVIDDLKSEKVVSLTAPACPYQFCYENLVNYRSSGCQYLKENSEVDSPLCLNFSAHRIVEEALKLIN